MRRAPRAALILDALRAYEERRDRFGRIIAQVQHCEISTAKYSRSLTAGFRQTNPARGQSDGARKCEREFDRNKRT